MTDSRELKRKICKIIDDAEFNKEEDEDVFQEKMKSLLDDALSFYNWDFMNFVKDKHKERFPNTTKV